MHQWFPVTPSRVRVQSHAWVFAYYVQPPEQRDDGKWRHALVFRNADRTEFGAFELISEKVTATDFERRYDVRKIAARIVDDVKYRRSLLRESAEIRELWENR